MDTKCACGIGSIFGSPEYIPRCAPGTRAVHNLAVTDGCIHSAGSKHTHSSEKKRRPANITSMFKGTFWAYIPSGNSTCVNDMDRHRGGAEHCCSSSAILPGHNRVAPVKRLRQASDQWLNRAASWLRARQRRSRPIPAEHPAGDASSIENNYWMEKKNPKNSEYHIKAKGGVHSEKQLPTINIFIIIDKHVKLNAIQLVMYHVTFFLQIVKL